VCLGIEILSDFRHQNVQSFERAKCVAEPAAKFLTRQPVGNIEHGLGYAQVGRHLYLRCRCCRGCIAYWCGWCNLAALHQSHGWPAAPAQLGNPDAYHRAEDQPSE
jgi:hypothetical protein